MDAAALKTELTTDPQALGYAKYVSAAGEIVAPNYAAALADLLNATTGPGAAPVVSASMSKNEFLLSVVAPIVPALQALTDEKASARWQQYLDLASSASVIDVASPTIQGLLAELVAAGLATQSAIDAATKRTGSRAEVLFGADAVIQAADVIAAIAGKSGWTATVTGISTNAGNCVASVQFTNGQSTETLTIQGDDLTPARLQQWAQTVITSRANRDAAQANLKALIGKSL